MARGQIWQTYPKLLRFMALFPTLILLRTSRLRLKEPCRMISCRQPGLKAPKDKEEGSGGVEITSASNRIGEIGRDESQSAEKSSSKGGIFEVMRLENPNLLK